MGILHPEAHMFFNQGITRHEPDVLGSIMTQMTSKSGIKRWGKKGRDSIHSDMKEIHMGDTFLLIHWNNMSHDQKKKTLGSHMLLK